MMKRHSKLMFGLILLSLSVVFGCVRTLHPIYTAADVTFDKRLIGTWKQTDGDNTW